MIIHADTKIAAILKKDPGALEQIVSISPMFSKLRNPLLRKLMAGRTSLQMAAKMAGCTLQDFYDKLTGPDFEIEIETKTALPVLQIRPTFLDALTELDTVTLDVRPMIAAGNDPIKEILEEVNNIKPGNILKIQNSFEPIPLISLLGKKGFKSYTETINENLVETYFYKPFSDKIALEPAALKDDDGDWQSILNAFESKLVYIDVRAFEMPMPMTSILEAIQHLKPGEAIFVYHKRIPVFLLTELADQGLDYRIKEVYPGEVHMLIYNPQHVSQ